MGLSVAAFLREESDSELPLVLAAILPLLKLVTIAVVGLVLTLPKVQAISRATLKLLSKLVFILFVPCLIFTCLGSSVTLPKILLWWFIPVNIIIATVLGFIMGYLVVLICRPPKEFSRFTMIATAFGNTGNIAYAMVTSICSSKNPFGDTCQTDGIAYASFSQWVSVVLVYTLVYHMMEPPLEYYEILDEDEEIEVQQEVTPVSGDVSVPLLQEAEWPMMEDNGTGNNKNPFIARLFNSIPGSSDIVDTRDDQIESIRCLAEPRVVTKIRVVAEQTPIKHVLQPPTIASLLAIIIGAIPAVKSVVYGNNAPLEFLTGSLGILADATVPSVMLILGGMLSEGPTSSNLGIKTTVGIIVARLILLPLLGFGVLYLADKWNLLIANDDMFRFVLLLQYATPSAILLGALANLRGYAVGEASALLFWQHIVAVFSFLLFLIIYFQYLIAYF